ncbi:C-GCAxxG-C-C family protein [Clostridium ljungdahlii]|uniref:Putative redox-active protein (C_GCAxxG_C_C) n=1 Tax=Clostridium ljungdahlii TaxID=1538 RepID=A0A168LYD2_9CLOT|nr:C-GCAxxG-C-C family protein [Clostridium ljungdahlii]OAA83865.1 putative redox-active protein (C_GCAxxG_C_C) [Clostridium ljungdahlii]
MREDEITELFKQGFDCGQVVLTNFAKELGMDTEQANKVAASFGGGMFCGETCGAVIGALIAIGLKYGHYLKDTPNTKNQNIAKVTEFREKFLMRYDSTVCKELLGYDISKPEEMKIILEKGLLFSFCPKLVAYVTEILTEILSEDVQ